MQRPAEGPPDKGLDQVVPEVAPEEEQGQGGGAVQLAVSKAEQLVTVERTLVLFPGFSGNETIGVKVINTLMDTFV